MRRWTRVASALLALAAAACATRRPPALDVEAFAQRPAPEAETGAARAVAAAFIAAEAAGDPGADTLLLPDAVFIASGIVMSTRPRLAALNGPGAGLIESAQTQVAGGVAWVIARYRFDAADPALSDRGRATLVLERQRAGWRIRHVHSSAVDRWER